MVCDKELALRAQNPKLNLLLMKTKKTNKDRSLEPESAFCSNQFQPWKCFSLLSTNSLSVINCASVRIIAHWTL